MKNAIYPVYGVIVYYVIVDGDFFVPPPWYRKDYVLSSTYLART